MLGPDFQKFWDACGKTGGSKGFAAIDAVTGEDIADPPAPEKKEPNQSGPVTKEVLESRDGKTIGISRGAMRALFLEGCEANVKWGHQVVGYDLTPDGVKAVFKDGSKSVEGDMLVGGEGIYSRVAKQVSDGKLKTYDTGARGVHGQAPTTAFKGLGEGVWRIVDDVCEERYNGP